MPTEKVFFKNSKGMKLAGLLHVPESNSKMPWPAVIRAHGYGSRKEGKTGQLLLPKLSNFVFFQFDFHGHGESEGKFEEVDAARAVDDLICAIDFVCGLPYVNKGCVAVVGSSFGGLAATLAAARHDKTAAVVLICPVSDLEPLRLFEIKYKKLGLSDTYKEAEKIKCPVLVIHGDKDDIVPIEDSLELVKHLKNGRLDVVKGADHQFSNPKHFDERINKTVEFIKEKLSKDG